LPERVGGKRLVGRGAAGDEGRVRGRAAGSRTQDRVRAMGIGCAGPHRENDSRDETYQ